jgi:hypothetical protein
MPYNRNMGTPRLQTRRTVLAAALAAIVLAAPGEWPAAAEQDVWAGVARVVAIGDVHGDYDQLVTVLRAAGVIDRRDRWSGGKTHLVQTGDVLDRGPDSRRALDLLMRLERQARSAGGRVHALLGNHEAMNVYGDLRYVSGGEYAAFRDRNSAALRDAFFRRYIETLAPADPAPSAAAVDDEEERRAEFDAQFPLGFVEHRQAFGPKGAYGRWLLQRNAVVKIDDTLFVHGGISPKYASLPIAEINARVRRTVEELAASGPPAVLEPHIVTDPEGPLWYRDLVTGDEAALQAPLAATLEAFGVRRMVVGHTVTDGVVMPRVGGRVIAIDVGLANLYGGPDACLLIENGRPYALHRGARLELPSDPGAPLLDYLRKAAALDPEGSRLRRKVAELEAARQACVRASCSSDTGRPPRPASPFPPRTVSGSGPGVPAGP